MTSVLELTVSILFNDLLTTVEPIATPPAVAAICAISPGCLGCAIGAAIGVAAGAGAGVDE